MMTARTFVICVALALTLVATPARGQQVDLAGMWSATLGNHEELPLRGDPGVEVGEYVGIPLNEAARQHADSWTPTMHSLLEWQGRVAYTLAPAYRTETNDHPDLSLASGVKYWFSPRYGFIAELQYEHLWQTFDRIGLDYTVFFAGP